MASETIIKKCDCKNEFQDRNYGKNMRVFNPAGKGQDGRKFRCSVCGKVIDNVK